MTSEEIKENFALDPADGKTLTAQLEKSLSRFIENNPDGTYLPPEQLLAEELGVARLTVRNALKKFIENGQITRQARKGTRITKKRVLEKIEINPLALEHFCLPRPKKPLRFLNFETLPFQQVYWEKVCESFNRQNPGCKVEMIPMNADMPVWKLSRLLREMEIDVFLHSHTFPEPLIQLASPLSEELRNSAASQDFQPEFASFWREEMYNYLLPLNLSVTVSAWNEDLAQQAGIDVSGYFEKKDLPGLLKHASSRLPENVYAFGHIWDIIQRAGCPASGREMEHLKTQIRILADILSHPRTAITAPERTFKDVIWDFYNQKILVLHSTHTNLYALGKLPFTVKELPSFPEPGCKKTMMTLNIALSRSSSRPGDAFKFMKFLLSEEVQELCGSIKKIPPLRRKQFFNFMERQFNFAPEVSLHWLRQHDIFIDTTRRVESFLGFAVYEIREELEALAEQKISVKEAIDRIQKKYYQPEIMLEINGA